jgi:hypothetical protein
MFAADGKTLIDSVASERTEKQSSFETQEVQNHPNQASGVAVSIRIV